MTSIYCKTKSKSSKNDSVCNSSRLSSTSRVSSLRNLFESNFKLSDITNVFKSKHTRNDGMKKNTSNKNNKTEFSDDKENRRNVVKAAHSKSGSNVQKKSCSNCQVENCCCKTFLREYDNTPTFRYRHVPKTPLREGTTNVNRLSHPNATSTVISDRIRPRTVHELSFPSDKDKQNKVYEIKYEFYKPKSNEPSTAAEPSNVETIGGSKKFRFGRFGDTKHGDEEIAGKVFEFTAEKKTLPKKDSYGFVNFTATSMSEGGYMNRDIDEKQRIFNRSEKWTEPGTAKVPSRNDGILKSSLSKGDEIFKSDNYSFKYGVPRIKNLAARENSHPYALGKSRLTVKGVKNRNLRNIKRKQKLADEKSLSRSYTFSGYDNFAYHPSAAESHLSNHTMNDDQGVAARNVSDAVQSKKFVSREEPDSTQTHSRMIGYNCPVTSFYIEKQSLEISPLGEANRTISDTKSSSSYDLYNGKQDASNKITNMFNKTSILKRHSSLGYLEEHDEDYNCQFTLSQRRRSLDNISRASFASSIRNVPEGHSKQTKQKKIQNSDIYTHALFVAVEHGHVKKVRIILESSPVNVNCLNSDGLSSLDVAVLTNNKPLALLLISYGAREGNKFFTANDMRNHLYYLLREAESRIFEMGASLQLNIDSDLSSLSSSSSNIPSINDKNKSKSKTFLVWQRRAKGLKRMLMGFELIKLPDPPSIVTIEVTSITSIMVHFTGSENEDSAIATKFKVQWSMDKDFSSLWGFYEVTDTSQLNYHITNLRRGHMYYIRVASGNVKGYSAYKLSSPSSIFLSSWRDITKKKSRFSDDVKETLGSLLSQVSVTHPYLKTTKLYGLGGEMLVNQRRKNTTIKQLFTASSKLQKHLRRRVYLSCLLYHEDKVLVTSEDFLPVIEVDENHPKKIHNDFHWLFKVALNWNDLKWLKSDIEKCQHNSVDFRTKLLQAAIHMQTALSIQELGKVYHKLIQDAEGTVVIPLVNYIPSPKFISVLNLKWLPLAKLTKQMNLVNISQSLMSSIPDQITYHHVCNMKLPRGLYLSYLKMRSSVDSVQIMVPSKTPNITPHHKIRDNPHVTAEEWEWLFKKKNVNESISNATPEQRLFIEEVVVAANRLFKYMQVSEEEAANHRLFDGEVIEVDEDVSLIMVVPPVETSCVIPDQRELLERPDVLPLAVQVFEMVHFGSYQLDLISAYARLSNVIELDVDLAQYNLRQAFSSSEISAAKSRVVELERLHTQLKTVWKSGRWLFDVLSFARDRFSTTSANMSHLLSAHPKRTCPSNRSRYLLPPKTTKSRSSFPGIDVGHHSESTSHNKNLESDAKQINMVNRVIPNESMSSTSSVESRGVSKGGIIKACETKHRLSRESSSSSLHSVSSNELAISRAAGNKVGKIGIQSSAPGSAIIEIYAAYNTGQNQQLHFKFHVSPKTTAREIVEMFVKQTNMSTLLKGKEGPIYSDQQINDFCLVAVVEDRERCLRDDFRLVQLQKPWRDGRLYVRCKSNVFAAIKCYSKHSSYV